ncbi:hypothetical protein ACOSQ4_013807 [Xanthoceras sorbifolium]
MKSGFLEEIHKPKWVSGFQKPGRRCHLLLDQIGRGGERRLLLPDGGGTASSHQFSGDGGGLPPPFAFFFNC